MSLEKHSWIKRKEGARRGGEYMDVIFVQIPKSMAAVSLPTNVEYE